MRLRLRQGARKRALALLLLTLVFWLAAPEAAFADDCSNPGDCFFSDQAAMLALIGIIAIAGFVVGGPAGAITFGFLASDLLTVGTGIDPLTGQRVNRISGVIGLIDPTPGNAVSRGGRTVKGGKHIDEFGGGTGKSGGKKPGPENKAKRPPPTPGDIANYRYDRQKQGRHVNTDPRYENAGYFNSHDDAQRVIDLIKSGNVKVLGKTNEGHVLIETKANLGFNHNPVNGFPDQPTNRFIIKGHSSASVVPTDPTRMPDA